VLLWAQRCTQAGSRMPPEVCHMHANSAHLGLLQGQRASRCPLVQPAVLVMAEVACMQD
jgi:hypothetical protein